MNIHNIQINGETIINAIPEVIAQILVDSFHINDLSKIAYLLGKLKSNPKTETKIVINITSEPNQNIPEAIQRMADANKMTPEEIIPVGCIAIVNHEYCKWDGEDWKPINRNTPDVTYIHTTGNHELAAYVNTYCQAEPEFNMMWTAITTKSAELNIILELTQHENASYTLKFGSTPYKSYVLWHLVEHVYVNHCK